MEGFGEALGESDGGVDVAPGGDFGIADEAVVKGEGAVVGGGDLEGGIDGAVGVEADDSFSVEEGAIGILNSAKATGGEDFSVGLDFDIIDEIESACLGGAEGGERGVGGAVGIEADDAASAVSDGGSVVAVAFHDASGDEFAIGLESHGVDLGPTIGEEDDAGATAGGVVVGSEGGVD